MWTIQDYFFSEPCCFGLGGGEEAPLAGLEGGEEEEPPLAGGEEGRSLPGLSGGIPSFIASNSGLFHTGIS